VVATYGNKPWVRDFVDGHRARGGVGNGLIEEHAVALFYLLICVWLEALAVVVLVISPLLIRLFSSQFPTSAL
jgi:hypothetical protein